MPLYPFPIIAKKQVSVEVLSFDGALHAEAAPGLQINVHYVFKQAVYSSDGFVV